MNREFLEECLERGMSLDTISELTGKHPSTVSYWLQSFGLEAVGARKHGPKGGLTREELEPLVEEGLTIEGIAGQLGVGETTVRRWLQKHGLKTRNAQRRMALDAMRRGSDREVELNCRRHGLTRFMGVGSTPRLRCAKCQSEAVARRRRKVKEILVAEAGGKCLLCGYAKHAGALQFHHLDPSTKSFGLGVRGITRSLERLRREAEKCALLCANCHAEVEAGVVELSVKSRESMAIRSSASD